MKKMALVLTLALLSFSSLAQAQEATGTGRPDPTGRGRYLQYGTEVVYPGATVLKTLPADAKCAPAGELVGVPLWNTTREGRVIASRLTEKAEVAMVGDLPYLCWCIGGHNRLFVPPQKSATQSVTQTVREVTAAGTNATATATATATLDLDGLAEIAKIYAASMQRVAPPEGGGFHCPKKCWIPLAIAGGGFGVYKLWPRGHHPGPKAGKGFSF